MENLPRKFAFVISKKTAVAIRKARRAIAETDKAKHSTWDRKRLANELNPDVATLQIAGAANVTVPIRCDILAKWTAAHDAESFLFEVDEFLAITIRAGQSSLKLLAPTFPAGVLPIKTKTVEGGCEILLDLDVAAACLTAKTLRARTAEAKKAGETMRAEATETRQREEYEQALQVLTAANIRQAAKSSRSLRKLKRWASRVAPILESLPNPLNLDDFRELDAILSPETMEAYAHKWLGYIAAKKRHDEYSPRGYYSASKERPRRAKEMNQAKRYAQAALLSGVYEHVAAFGFTSYASGSEIKIYQSHESLAGKVLAARRTARSYTPPLAMAA